MVSKQILISSCCSVLLAVPMLAQLTKLSTKDKTFLKMAAVADMTQAHMGEMAMNDAAQSGIKNFGQTLEKDHTKAYQDLSMLDTKLGQTTPKGIDIRRDQPVEHLTALKGNKFDQQFLRDEVMDHQRLLAAFKQEAQHGQDPEVKAFANQEIPNIEEHLRDAQNLMKHPA